MAGRGKSGPVGTSGLSLATSTFQSLGIASGGSATVTLDRASFFPDVAASLGNPRWGCQTKASADSGSPDLVVSDLTGVGAPWDLRAEWEHIT